MGLLAKVKAAISGKAAKKTPKVRTIKTALREKEAPPKQPRRQRTKHGKLSLAWRKWARPHRRRALSNTLSRALAGAVHPIAELRAQAPQWPEEMTPDERADRMHRWAKNKLKAKRKRRLVVDTPMAVPEIAERLDMVALNSKVPFKRIRVKRTAGLHGVSWKALRKAVRRRRGAAWLAMRKEHEAA
jgi:hypothetical protein